MPDHRWLILHLEAPMLAFGGVAIDQVGVTRDFPAASMLTGLLANALGWTRGAWERHQRLQDRLVHAARRDRGGTADRLTDTQNAKLEKMDRGWTSWGYPEGRDGASYAAPHRRLRDYHTDAYVIVALRLDDAEEEPTLDQLAAALDRPARPLFIGRKSCLPAAPLRRNEAFVRAPTAYDALSRVDPVPGARPPLSALWPMGEGPTEGKDVVRIVDLPDQRNWSTGLHGGTRRVVEGTIVPREGAA
jgi:CRISPR system Cascade subunit CasD